MPICIVFGFPAVDGRVESLPGKVPTSLRGIPPRRQYLAAVAPGSSMYCGSVKPVDAKDGDLEDLLFLSTDLFGSLEEAKRAVAEGGELAEVYQNCANAVFYEIDIPASATKGAVARSGKPMKAARRTGAAKKTGASKTATKKAGAGKTAPKSAKKSAKAVSRKAGAKKSAAGKRLAKAKKGPGSNVVGRAGIPRKKSSD